MGRRRFLTCTASLFACKSALASPGPARVVSLDWGVSETLYAMKIPVAGAADNAGYDRMIEAPATPPSTLNLGLWSAPNIELLQELKPDLILIQAWQQGLLPLLRRIGPTETVTIYTRQGSAYEHANLATHSIAQRLSQIDAAELMLTRGEELLDRCRELLSAHHGESVIVVMIVDGRGFVAFSRASIFHDIVERLGLINAWTGAPQLLCGASIIDLTTLVSSEASHVIVIDPPGQANDEAFFRSQLWQSLPIVKAQRVKHIPSLWEFGALPTGYRFAGLMVSAFTGTEVS